MWAKAHSPSLGVMMMLAACLAGGAEWEWLRWHRCWHFIRELISGQYPVLYWYTPLIRCHHCTVLYCAVMYCIDTLPSSGVTTVLCCTVLYCTVLYCIDTPPHQMSPLSLLIITCLASQVVLLTFAFCVTEFAFPQQAWNQSWSF